jgi:signal transduction histidine kinase
MNPENSSSMILRSRWLILARAAWLVVGALAVGLFVAGIQAEYRQLQLGCPTPACASIGGVAPVELSSLEKLGLSPEFFAAYGITLELTFALVFVGVAALIFWQKSSDRPALFAAWTLLLFGTATQTYAMQTLVATHPSWRLPVDSLHFLGSASFSLFLYTFPDGRFIPRWTRWVALVWIAWLFPRYWFSEWPPSGLGLPNLVIWLSALGTAVYSQVHRYRKISNRVQRQQTKWVVFGIGMGLALFIIVNIVVSATAPVPVSTSKLTTLMVGAALMNSALLLIPLSIGIAILRYHLFDIDILINRTLVYGTLILIVTGLYIILVGMVGVLFQSVGNSFLVILATGLVAVLFQPLRQRLQRGINHFMYGERDDPYAVLSRLSQRLEATLAPEAVLPTLVETIAQSLKLPYAGIMSNQDGEFRIAAEFGRSQGEPIRLPLSHQGEPVGELLLAPRAPGDIFTPAERRLLDDLARQAGIAVHAVRLTTDLQRSRERLVTAREEERRRLRRDLHDGLGPQLASLTLKLETARNRLTDDSLADSLLADLAKRTQDATADIRRLVYGLRPPTLDELGLVSALREAATQYSQQGFNGVHITIDAPENLPPLPAAVEVAVYRITQEALTNVVRHAEARICNVRITLDEQTGWLCLEVQDDGRGLSSTRRAGVGLNSMRERAEELGGMWTIESLATGGTRILVRLSCRLPDYTQPKKE